MKTYKVALRSVTPYSQSRYHETAKLEKESADDYDKRTCREHLHYDPSSLEIYIPPMAIKNCLVDAAQFLGMKIKGRGQSTYTKHFQAGVLLAAPIPLGIKRDDVPIEANFLNADGIRGSAKRVVRRFPRIDSWGAEFDLIVADETVTEPILREHLVQAGLLIGIGRFRPRNGGFYGRFEVLDLSEVES